MEGYSYFAEFYDKLTEDIDYEAKAKYLLDILKKYKHSPGLTLDLACGTGNLTVQLKKMGIDIFGVDGSEDMLSIAKMKSVESGLEILYLCQEMKDLDLYGTVDTVFCTLDSINHITNTEELLEVFKKVKLFLNKGGYFIFDCNTVYKHEFVLSNNTFVYDIPQVYCVWQNRFYKEDNSVDIFLDFFRNCDQGKYERYSENFSERAYTQSQIKNMLDVSGLEFVAVYDDMTFETPKDKTEREVYICRS